MRILNSEQSNISSHQDWTESEKKEKAKKLLSINFEFIGKQITFSNALEVDLQFVKNSSDEFYLTNLAIELMTGAKEEDDLRVYLEEVSCCTFFNLCYKTLVKDQSEVFKRLAQDLVELMAKLPAICKQNWNGGGKKIFLKELLKVFPDGGCEFIQKQIAMENNQQVLA